MGRTFFVRVFIALFWISSIGQSYPWVLRSLSRSLASIRRSRPQIDRSSHEVLPHANTTATDEYFLRLALQEAYRAKAEDEVPIGALVVQQPQDQHGLAFILAHNHNRVEQRRDATAHAEVLALRQAASRTRNWRLTNTTLYSTVEPCVMCCAAAQAFRVQRIVYGTPDHRLGGIVSHVKLLNVTHPYHTIADVQGGVCAEECGNVIRDFFREKRKQRKRFGTNSRKTNSKGVTKKDGSL